MTITGTAIVAGITFVAKAALAAVWPILVQFGAWIAAGAVAVLGFLFSPAVRKYTIAGIAIAVILGFTWVHGFETGKGHGSSDICKDPAFTQLVLTGKFSPALKAWAVKHNDLGARLGCWDNSNIR